MMQRMGLRRYLETVSKWYVRIIRLGLLKRKHAEIHYLSEVISRGHHVMDIGANLGYYSYFMSKLVGLQGKVYAVEPISLFREVWEKNTKKTGNRNLQMFPYALGGENKTVKMGMPEKNGVAHHGMTRISDADAEIYTWFDAEMRIPDVIFKDIELLDFVKIDVEGFEYYVLQNMQQTLAKHLPILQVELSGSHRADSMALLESWDFIPHTLVRGILVPAGTDAKAAHHRDFYFIHRTKF